MISARHNEASAASPRTEKPFRTDAWLGERTFDLHFPDHWDVTVWWPPTPAALTDLEIAAKLERPVGQPPLRNLCRGKSRPLVIIDDLNRPTPVDRVMPLLLRHLSEAGIPASAVRILLSTGTHGAPPLDLVSKKVGAEAASACKVLIHDAYRNCVSIGCSSLGTPVFVDRAVLDSDFVMGIGGVYPNDTAGYGGGAKLALGVLGFQSIKTLHYRHRGIGWGRWEADGPLRRELNEIARMIGLDTMISLQVNADREVIRVTCGDHFSYFKEEVTFSRQFFSAPAPGEADVVICNAYPSDLSVTVVHQKATAPLRHTAPGASRIVIASCAAGPGHHGLFPIVNRPRYSRALQIARRISMMKLHELAGTVIGRLRKTASFRHAEARRGIWFYRPGNQSQDLPSNIPGYCLLNSWTDVLRAVEAEQGNGKRLKVFVYPCAPLQILTSLDSYRNKKPDADASGSHRKR